MVQADAVNASDALLITVKSHYSLLHLNACDHFAMLAKSVEERYAGSFDHSMTMQLNAYATSTLFSAISFLEAHINEIFFDCAEGSFEHRTRLPIDKQKLIGDIWKLGTPRTSSYSIIDKYDYFLTLSNLGGIDRSISATQDVAALIKLRNSLIHFEPAWDSIPTRADSRHYLALKGKYSLNPFFKDSDSFIPKRGISAGLAIWSVKKIIEFADLFCERSQTIPIYQHMRGTLATNSLSYT